MKEIKTYSDKPFKIESIFPIDSLHGSKNNVIRTNYPVNDLNKKEKNNNK